MSRNKFLAISFFTYEGVLLLLAIFVILFVNACAPVNSTAPAPTPSPFPTLMSPAHQYLATETALIPKNLVPRKGITPLREVKVFGGESVCSVKIDGNSTAISVGDFTIEIGPVGTVSLTEDASGMNPVSSENVFLDGETSISEKINGTEWMIVCERNYRARTIVFLIGAGEVFRVISPIPEQNELRIGWVTFMSKATSAIFDKIVPLP